MIEILKKKIQEAEAIIVGGASGLSAAAGFRFYYMNDATFKQIAGQLAVARVVLAIGSRPNPR